MSEELVSTGNVVGVILTAVLSWAGTYLAERSKRKKMVEEELKKHGLDIIEELREDRDILRRENKDTKADAEKHRDQAWRWRTEHTELAVELDRLTHLVAMRDEHINELKERNARLKEDADRYQRELGAKTQDLIRDPDDPTGPTAIPRRR